MIRTRDFAKTKFSRSTESLATSDKKNAAGADVGVETVAQYDDIISLSSAEEKRVLTPKSEPKPRKKRERKPKTESTPVRKVRKWMTPLKANYSKITDFFQKIKSEGTSFGCWTPPSIFITLTFPQFQLSFVRPILKQRSSLISSPVWPQWTMIPMWSS